MERQYELFAIDESNDDEIVKKNKQSITLLMKSLEKSGILAAETFRGTYKVVAEPYIGTEDKVFKVVEKINQNDSMCVFKALKKTTFTLSNKLNFAAEMQFLAKFAHENVIKIEKAFFEFDEENYEYSFNMVMPWINHNFISWLKNTPKTFKSSTSAGAKICDIKRSFNEVRDVLISLLDGIGALHSQKIIHLNLRFDIILVKEVPLEVNFFDGTSENIHDKAPHFAAVIAGFGIGPNLYKISTHFMAPKFFRAPEIVKLFEIEVEKQQNGDSNARSELMTPKADIFSFGALLFKIFIADDTDYPYQDMISAENIRSRIQQLFGQDPSISDDLIEDLEHVMQQCLDANAFVRPHASELSFDHPFFNKNIKASPKSPKSPVSPRSQYALTLQIPNINNASQPTKQLSPNSTKNAKIMKEEFEIALNLLEGSESHSRDLKKARDIFERLSSSFNHIPSKFFYGFMLGFGLGGSIDRKTADFILKKARGTAKSYFEFNDLPLGFSHFAIGYMFYCGLGVVPHDYNKALECFQKASSNSFAQNWLGLMYQVGDGVKRDLKVSIEWLKKSAEKGNCMGACNLGNAIIVTQQDYEEALKLFTPFAEDHEYWMAEYNLAYILDNGLGGVEIDKQKALVYYEKAAKQGDDLSRVGLERLQRKM